MIFITLKPNGKLYGNFVGLEMGLPNTERESNAWNGSVFTKFSPPLSGYNIFSYLLSERLEMRLILNSEELFE